MKLMARLIDRPWFVAMAASCFTAAIILTAGLSHDSLRPYLPSAYLPQAGSSADHMDAIVHYATSRIVPQQSLAEIRVSYAVLRRRAPCNFLVFGLGHDSVMWANLNPGGTTLFLEDDPEWVRSVVKASPTALQALTIQYRTRLSDADRLLEYYGGDAECSWTVVGRSGLKGSRCQLALADLPAEVYEREWDVIMIDAPKGYIGVAPGRMGAIYSAGVMARARRSPGETDVFLHDVNRRVEKVYAEEFLCVGNRMESVGRLWHFRIPPEKRNINRFC
ncbi:putative methyltransferase [Nymphaea thermarum]|nr:putative methyltransferase [Nymphaea thermarum]